MDSHQDHDEERERYKDIGRNYTKEKQACSQEMLPVRLVKLISIKGMRINKKKLSTLFQKSHRRLKNVTEDWRMQENDKKLYKRKERVQSDKKWCHRVYSELRLCERSRNLYKYSCSASYQNFCRKLERMQERDRKRLVLGLSVRRNADLLSITLLVSRQLGALKDD